MTIRAHDATRRAILRGVTSTVAMAALAPARGARAAYGRTADQSPGGQALTILYPAGPGAWFEADYYRDHHMKLFMDIYGASIDRFELCLVSDATRAAPFVALMNVWIADFTQFHVLSTEAAYKRMGSDKVNFSNIQSTIDVDAVQGAVGVARSHIRVGDQCISFLYPNAGGAQWPGDRHAQAHLSRLQAQLGPRTVKRIEMRKGVQLLDAGAPAYLGDITFYVADGTTVDAAWSEHGAEVQKMVSAISSATPVRLNSLVHGIESSHHDA
jgi:hypothetical protein